MKDLEILAPCPFGSTTKRVTRIEVIENSADASTQSPDGHMHAKYGRDSKTKQHDRII